MDDRRYNNNGELLETLNTPDKPNTPDTHNISDEHPPPYTPKRRKPWNRLAFILIILGGIIFGIGWATGSRGAGIYIRDGRLRIYTADRNSYGETEITLPAGTENAQRINISTTSYNIHVLPTHESKPRLVVHGDVTPHITFADNTLSISTRHPEVQSGSGGFQMFFIGSPRRNITLYMPDNIYKILDISSTSGNVRIEGFYSETLTARSTSGNVRVTDIRTENGNLQSTSGNVEVTDSHIITCTLRSVSGNVAVNSGSVYTLNGTSTSGNVTVDTSVIKNGSAELRSTSGNIRFTAHTTSHQWQTFNYSLNTRSGVIRINGNRSTYSHKNDTNPYFTIDARTTSGNISLNYPNRG